MLVIAQENGGDSPVFPVLGIVVCVGVRLIGLRFGVGVPIAPSERERRGAPGNERTDA